MSLILTYSGNIDCGCNSVFAGRGLFQGQIRVGDYYIKKDDFDALIMYYLTNTDLEIDDNRLSLIKNISRLNQVEGYNRGNFRLSDEPISPPTQSPQQ